MRTRRRYPGLLQQIERLRQERRARRKRLRWLRRRLLSGEAIVERDVDRLFAQEVAALGLEPDERDASRERAFLAAVDARVTAHEEWLNGGL